MNSEAHELYEQAYAAVQTGDTVSAQRLAEAAAEHGSIDALRLLGLIHWDTHESDEYLGQAAARGDSHSHAFLAQRRLISGEALQALQQLGAIDPSNLDAFSAYLLARASWLTGTCEPYQALIESLDTEEILQRQLWPAWLYQRGAEVAWVNYHLLCLIGTESTQLQGDTIAATFGVVLQHNYPHTLAIAASVSPEVAPGDFLGRIDPLGREELLEHLGKDLALARSAGGSTAAEWCEQTIHLLKQDHQTDVGSMVRDIINLQILGADLTLFRVLPSRLAMRAELTDARGEHFTYEVDLGGNTPVPNLHHHTYLSPYVNYPTAPPTVLHATPADALRTISEWDEGGIPLSIWALLNTARESLTQAGVHYVCRWLLGANEWPRGNLLAAPIQEVSTSYLSGKDPWEFPQPEHNDERILRVWNAVLAEDSQFAHDVLAPILALHRVSGDLPKVRQAILDSENQEVARLLESTPISHQPAATTPHGGDETQDESPEQTLHSLPTNVSALIEASTAFLEITGERTSTPADWPRRRDLDLGGASRLPREAHYDAVTIALARGGLVALESADIANLVDRLMEMTSVTDPTDQSELVRASWRAVSPRENVTALPAREGPVSGISPALLRSSEVSVEVLLEVISGPLAHECAEVDHDPEFCFRRIAAGNPLVTTDLLARWAQRGDSCLKLGVAVNPKATTDVLLVLADDSDLAVRNSILSRTEIPIATLLRGLTRSYSDENYDAHELVPQYYDAMRMLHDYDNGASQPRIRSILESTADETLLKEAWTEVLNWYRFDDVNHPDDGYIDAFQVHIVKSIISGAVDVRSLFDSLIEHTSSGIQLSCSSVEFTTFDGVNTTMSHRQIPRDFHASVAVTLREMPLDIQSDLALAGSWGVRFLIACKPEATSEALKVIFETDPGQDEYSLEDHDMGAYFDAGIDWEQLWPNELGLAPVDDISVLADLETDLQSAARATAVLHPNFPISLLPEAARSADSAIRAAAARSPHATEEILRTLAVDPDLHVRQGVIANPLSSDEIRAIAALTP